MTLPALLIALFWRRFNTTGSIVGTLGGLIASIGLIALSVTGFGAEAAESAPAAAEEPVAAR